MLESTFPWICMARVLCAQAGMCDCGFVSSPEVITDTLRNLHSRCDSRIDDGAPSLNPAWRKTLSSSQVKKILLQNRLISPVPVTCSFWIILNFMYIFMIVVTTGVPALPLFFPGIIRDKKKINIRQKSYNNASATWLQSCCSSEELIYSCPLGTAQMVTNLRQNHSIIRCSYRKPENLNCLRPTN